MRRRALFLAAAILALTGGTSLGRGAWIFAKAELAQVLLERAWQRTLEGGERVRPWSWADTWPVARLRAPRHEAEMIVLAGSSGAVLAFGPGHLDGSARPGEVGNTVIAGHRDTHFEFLRDLELGDAITLESASGSQSEYRIESLRIVDASDGSAIQPTARETLTLVTCYPFDALVPGGPLRYVVRASKVIS
ncbi:MAG: class GN sortase [Acidobacteriota bacterium]